MPFCLPKFAVDKLIGSLPSDPSVLINMTSEQRRAFLEKSIGVDNAQSANALFESKLLLKNQQQGLITWVKKVAGISPEVRYDMISKVQRLDKALTNAEMEVFLEDLVAQRLGIGVTAEETGNLIELSKQVETTKTPVLDMIADMNKKGLTWQEMKALQNDKSSEFYKKRIEYGTSLVAFKQYVSDLKVKAAKTQLKEYAKRPDKALADLSGLMKSILASFDNSFFGRQGIKVLYNNPTVWMKSFLKSFKDLSKGVLLNEDATVAVKADIFSRINALNNNYSRSKIAIGLDSEEAFPSSLPTKIPLLGRLFTASESAYNAAALRMRADLADAYIANAEQNGVNIKNKDEIKSIGLVVNSLTGRGNLGTFEASANTLNKIFFSARFLKSQFDVVLQPLNPNISKFARKTASKNLARSILSVVSILALSDFLFPGSVDWKEKMGKLKIMGVWVDITGGFGSVLQLAFNIYRKVKNQKGKYGEITGWDLVQSFMDGKLSPILGVMRDITRGYNYNGEKPTPTNILKNTLIPIPVQNIIKQLNQKNVDIQKVIMVSILDGLGLSAQIPKK